MYMKKSAINGINKARNIAILIAVFVALGWFMKPTSISGAEKIENIMTLEYHRNFTVEVYNGKVDAVYIDETAYNVDVILGNSEIDHCTHVKNDEAHNCLLTDTIEMWMFLNKTGYTP